MACNNFVTANLQKAFNVHFFCSITNIILKEKLLHGINGIKCMNISRLCDQRSAIIKVHIHTYAPP